jgi:hypothetical protein
VSDDEGVARSDMTREYLRAVETYHLSYSDLKRMARQGIEHSFLPSQSLWADTKLVFRTAPPCATDPLGAEKTSAACQEFLTANERARLQWTLESAFAKFEKKY